MRQYGLFATSTKRSRAGKVFSREEDCDAGVTQNLPTLTRLKPSFSALSFIEYPPRVYVKRRVQELTKVMKDKLPEISKEKQKLLSRIKRLAGQITAVEHSVTEGDECADILMLLAAIRGGVNSLMAEILEDHIRLHITHPDSRTESPEELTEDLISLVRAYLK